MRARTLLLQVIGRGPFATLAGACLLVMPAAGQPPVVAAEEVLRLGGPDAPEHLAFVRPPTIQLDDGGRLLIRDPIAARIWVLGADGQLQRGLGGRGEGPGEFTSPSRMGLVGDSIWVIDFPTPRVSFFDRDGAHLRTNRLDPVDFGFPLSAPSSINQLLENGYALAIPTAFPVGVAGRHELPVLHGNRSWERSRQVSHRVMPNGLTIEGVGNLAFRPIPIPPETLVDPLGRGWAVLDWDPDEGSEVVIHRFLSDGTEISRLTVPIGARPLNAARRQALVNRGVEMARPYVEGARSRGTVRGSTVELVEAGLFLPASLPPFVRGFIDTEQRVWFQPWPSDGWAEWLVVGPQGVEMTVRVPEEVRLQTASSGEAWGVIVGDLDVPYLVKYAMSNDE